MEPVRRLALVVLLSAAPVLAGAAPLTLRQCIEAAYGLSPALKADALDIEGASQEVARQRRALLPSVAVNVVAGLIDGYPVTPFAVATGEDLENGSGNTGSTRQVTTVSSHSTTSVHGVTHTFDSSTTKDVRSQALPRQTHRADHAFYGAERIEVDYPLFQNGSILGLNDAPAVAGARAEKHQLEWTRKLAEGKVVFDLCNAFFIAQWYQEKLARDERRLGLSRQRLAIVKAQYELQLMLAQDVEFAKAQLAADEQTLAATKQSVKDSYAVLALLIGQPPRRVAQLDASPPVFPALPAIDSLLDRVRAGHPAIGAQQAVVDQAMAKVRLDQAALQPTVIAASSYTLGENLNHISAASADTPGLYAAGLTVNMPVFDWGARLSELRESRAKAGAETAREEQVKMDLSTGIARLYDAIHDLERQAAAATQALVGAANAARLAGEQRAAGSVDELALVAARQAQIAAEDNVQNARLGEVQAYVQLEEASGGAWRWTR